MADCIEREAAFNAILKLVPKVDGDGYCWVIRGDAAQAIDSIPSADVAEVRHGKWINGYKAGDTVYVATCSLCNTLQIGHKGVSEFNFCPNCGCDMR